MSAHQPAIHSKRTVSSSLFESLLILLRRNLSAFQIPNVPYGSVITILTTATFGLSTYTREVPHWSLAERYELLS